MSKIAVETTGAAPGKPQRPVRETVTIAPRRGLLDLDLASIWKYRELLLFLAYRDLKVRYKQAALGAAWAVIQPIFSVIVFTVVFSMFARFPSDGVPYPIFAFASLLPWTYFSEAMRRSTMSLVGDSELVRKIYFPRVIIPIATVATPLVDFFISLAVLLVAMSIYGMWPGPTALLVVPLLLLPMLLAFSIGLWLSPINVKFRDVGQIVPFALQIGMYASPIVYPLSMVPDRWRDLYSLNPMVGVIEAFRWALLGLGQPDMRAIGISFGFTVLLLVSGLIFFRRMEQSFADVI